jgi:hypothetical protein
MEMFVVHTENGYLEVIDGNKWNADVPIEKATHFERREDARYWLGEESVEYIERVPARISTPVSAQHHIVLIGNVGSYTAYIGLTRAQAIKRFTSDTEYTEEQVEKSFNIRELDVTDTFEAYDLWTK